jgi:hypothetical protein
MNDLTVQEWMEKEGFAVYSYDGKNVSCKIQDMVEHIIALREMIAELENNITVIGGNDDV